MTGRRPASTTALLADVGDLVEGRRQAVTRTLEANEVRLQGAELLEQRAFLGGESLLLPMTAFRQCGVIRTT